MSLATKVQKSLSGSAIILIRWTGQNIYKSTYGYCQKINAINRTASANKNTAEKRHVIKCNSIKIILTSISSDCIRRSHGGFTALGRFTSQYAIIAAKAPMPTKVEAGRLRKNWLKSSNSGRRKFLRISCTCIFSKTEMATSAESREEIMKLS